MVFTRDTASQYAADGNAQNVVGPISTFSELPKISADGSTVVDAEFSPIVGGYGICTFSTTNSTGCATDLAVDPTTDLDEAAVSPRSSSPATAISI